MKRDHEGGRRTTSTPTGDDGWGGANPVAEIVSDIDNPLVPTRWRDTVIPDDFSSFNFTPLEEDTRALTAVDDTWLQERGSTPTLVMCDTVPSIHQVEIDTWLRKQHPKLHVSIAPSVRTAVIQDQSPNGNADQSLFGPSFRRSLNDLISTGCRAEEQIARAELSSVNQRGDGVGRNNIEV